MLPSEIHEAALVLEEMQQAEHLKRRKEIWEAKQANSGKSSPENKDRGRPEGFASDTAAKTGVSKRSINQAISRAEKIPEPIREKIEGTKRYFFRLFRFFRRETVTQGY